MKKNYCQIFLVITLIGLIYITYLNYNQKNKKLKDINIELLYSKTIEKEFTELSLGIIPVNKGIYLNDFQGNNFSIESLPNPTITFYFNHEGCKSCNETYIHNEFERIKSYAIKNNVLNFTIISNFTNNREFYAHQQKFSDYSNVTCLNISEPLFCGDLRNDFFYFIIDEHMNFNSFFLPDYLNENNNIRYFDLVFSNYALIQR